MHAFFDLYSCSEYKNIVGKYATIKNSNKFQFNKDSTFIYEYGFLELYKHSTGIWKKKNRNTIELSSKIKDVSVPWNTYKRDNDSANSVGTLSIKVKVIGDLTLKDYICQIDTNKHFYDIKSCDSLLDIPLSLTTKTLELHFMRLPKGKYSTSYVAEPLTIPEFGINPETGKTVVIEAIIKDLLFYYRPFNSELIKIGHNCIRFYNPYRKKYQRIPKIADSLNIFSRVMMTQIVHDN